MFYPLSDNDYDLKPHKELIKQGFKQEQLAVLNKNPDYIASEIGYFRRQQASSFSFDSFNEFLDEVKDEKHLVSVNYAFGVNDESADCNKCNSTGLGVFGTMFDKTFYSYDKPHHKDREALVDENGNTVVSYYGWGSNKDFDEEDFAELKKYNRVDKEIETFEQFQEWVKNPMSICGVGRYCLIKGRAARYEKEENCSMCQGNGYILLPATKNPIKLVVWMTNTYTGDCGSYTINQLIGDDIEKAADYLLSDNSKRNNIIKDFIENGLEMSQENFNWYGASKSDCFHEYDNVKEFSDDWDMAPDSYNEFVNLYLDDEGALNIWVILPRKGYSQFIRVKNAAGDLEKLKQVLQEAVDRNENNYINIKK